MAKFRFELSNQWFWLIALTFVWMPVLSIGSWYLCDAYAIKSVWAGRASLGLLVATPLACLTAGFVLGFVSDRKTQPWATANFAVGLLLGLLFGRIFMSVLALASFGK
jgi:hypothetical protein